MDEIITRVQKFFRIREGIAIELHPRDVNVDTLETLKGQELPKLA
jgi:hypothetical protein